MRRILIIEDDRVDREIYKHCLKQSSSLQFDFAESSSGAGGIELSRKLACRTVFCWTSTCPIWMAWRFCLGFEVEDGRLPCAVVMLTACGGEELAVTR